MTYEQFASMVRSINLPYAYYQFPNGTETEPPFICFYYPGTDGVFADDRVYARREQWVIELYSKTKDFAAEAAVEAALSANDLPYTRYESYVDSEQMIMQSYEGEVLIDG